MAELKRNTPNLAMAQIASMLMGANPQGHIYHLQTTSFAAHKALNEFYDGVVEHRDAIIETYQGQFGIIRGYKLGPMLEDDMPIAYLKELRIRIQALRYDAVPKEYTNIHNEIDNAITLIDSTLYKLINLK